MNKGRIFIISAPSGTGKTTLINRLCTDHPDLAQQTTSCTTRPKREGETHSQHYHFVMRDEFLHKVEAGEFLEWAEIYGELYGTLRSDVEAITDGGKHALLVIDTQGAEKLMDAIDPIFIFIEPPSLEELKNRLEKRQTDTKEINQKRLDLAVKELEKKDNYDYVICNDDLERAYTDLKNIILGVI